MKVVLQRMGISFAVSAIAGTIVHMLIELCVQAITGNGSFTTLSPEYLANFTTESMAVYVNILLYGIIGATFSVCSLLYENEKMGFVIQNVLFCILTGVVWIPIVTVIWQLYRYPSALRSTIMGFVVTYVFMTIFGYQIKKKEIEEINESLAGR